MSTDVPIVPTSAVSLVSCAHGRQRRAERGIERRDLQAAIKYGARREARPDARTGKLRWKVQHEGVVYVTDATLRREITSYRVGPPALMPHVPLTVIEQLDLHAARERVRGAPSSWTSHTVLVVDGSASMKQCDVPGAFNRSDAVWAALVFDLLGEQLERGLAAPTDIVSIVEIRERATTLCEREPLTWGLLNQVLDLHGTRAPRSHGCYAPALAEAERLLLTTQGSGCALGLLVLSDGRPSDHVPVGAGSIGDKHAQMVREWTANLASQLGRRLSIAAVGFGPPHADFDVLRAMAAEGAEFGASSTFVHACLSTATLGTALTTLSRSVSTTRAELTAQCGSVCPREVRAVRREARSGLAPGAEIDVKDWTVYAGASSLIGCWRLDEGLRTWQAAEPFGGARVAGVMVHERIFGEGAERMVHRFHELASDMAIVGAPLVAKETRFVHSFTSKEHMDYHRVFLRTQGHAERLARRFNAAVAQLGAQLGAPRVEFLDARIYVVRDVNLGEYGRLVEKQLDPLGYTKWNSNNGFVRGQAETRADSAAEVGSGSADARALPADPPCVNVDRAAAHGVLGAIAESDEEAAERSDGEVDDGSDDGSDGGSDVPTGALELSVRGLYVARARLQPELVPPAFTHFSYECTGGRMMVCDLQGTLTPPPSADGTPTYELTDPVIHFGSTSGRTGVYGRTDRGRLGMSRFFETHTCNELCCMLRLPPRDAASTLEPLRRNARDARRRRAAKFGSAPRPLANALSGGITRAQPDAA